MFKKSAWMAFFSLSLLMVGPATAHGPTPQKATELITIAAAPAVVWAKIKDFANIAAWHPGIAQSIGEGTDRTFTLKSGGDIEEGVDEADDATMTLRYRQSKENVDALPVSSYSATIRVAPSGDGSEVEWIVRLYRADTTNEPAEDKNDAAALKAMGDFIKQGLEGLKAKSEAKG